MAAVKIQKSQPVPYMPQFYPRWRGRRKGEMAMYFDLDGMAEVAT
jgi:hypothetical protein